MPPLAQTDLYERFLFNTREQIPSEPLENFLDSLRQLSRNCKYEKDGASQTHVRLLIRDRFISGMRNKNVQRQLLQYQSSCLPIEKAVDLAKKYAETLPQKDSLEITKDSDSCTKNQCIKIENIETTTVLVKNEVEGINTLRSDEMLDTEKMTDNLTLECVTAQKNLLLPSTFENPSDEFDGVNQNDLLQFDIEGANNNYVEYKLLKLSIKLQFIQILNN